MLARKKSRSRNDACCLLLLVMLTPLSKKGTVKPKFPGIKKSKSRFFVVSLYKAKQSLKSRGFKSPILPRGQQHSRGSAHAGFTNDAAAAACGGAASGGLAKR
jgi:hypothetical protein